MTPDQVIEALALPREAMVGQRVPKTLLVENGAPTAADKRLIEGGVEELRWIAALKPTAVIVNIARGALIDEPALVAALVERRIKGAAMDVLETEPLPPDSPLWDLDNVLFSPHVAGHSDVASKTALAEMLADNLRRFAAGEPLRNVMDVGSGT